MHETLSKEQTKILSDKKITDLICELYYVKAYSTSKIARYIKDTTGIQVNAMDVYEVVKTADISKYGLVETTKDNIIQVLDENKSKLPQIALETKQQLEVINQKLTMHLENKDARISLQAAKTLLDKLEFQRKWLEMYIEREDKKASTYQEVTQAIIETIKALEKEGYITINKDLPEYLKR